MDKNYKSDYQPFHIFFYQKRTYFRHNMTSKFEIYYIPKIWYDTRITDIPNNTEVNKILSMGYQT